MDILLERKASPREIAADLDQPVNNITYHIDLLVDLGCIELVDVKPARGGRVAEHFYRAIQRPYFDTEMWNQVDGGKKVYLATALMRLISQDLNEAMATGTFYKHDHKHTSRTLLVVDRAGWDEVMTILERALGELLDVPEAVAKRAKDSGTKAKTMPVSVAIIQFETPPPKST